MKSTKKTLLLASLSLISGAAQAQELKDNYIQWWSSDGSIVTDVLPSWKTSHKVNEDDNFFISRVKPKQRFTHAATQVNKDLLPANDKRVMAWIPINDPSKNALPDGVYDSEVFSMWSYVNHWGDWTAPIGRIPASLLDVAHKNGVAVSGVWGIPYGSLSSDWYQRLEALVNTDTDLMASYLKYYGQDGLGYNSEYSEGSYSGITKKISAYHAELVKKMVPDNPIFENVWYDGTNDSGYITFDQGLSGHNAKNFGDKDNIAASLFLNYNWNTLSLLNRSVTKAKALGRDPLYLYCGINMQGGEPNASNVWSLLNQKPLSIGLWGAHERNMFWESRAEKGSDPDVKQNTYLHRIEQWFTGGTRNPANNPPLNGSLSYSVDNVTFPGMSSMMTAKSTLSWDLNEEPFISYFNLGNGKFFNWQGERQHNSSWYNIGVQDYLPTWRWWFASSLLQTDVPDTGLAADFVWDDAYAGGSCVQIAGSTSDEYLHLFKTGYALADGDVITVRFKHIGGSGKVNLVLTANGSETSAINEAGMNLLAKDNLADDEEWVERQFVVDSQLAGKELALIALHFTEAERLTMKLGEVSIVRGHAPKPATPVITSSKLLAFNQAGADAKVIFDMPNDKAAGEPCYNTDVNTSLFKLWAEQENGQRTLMGVTTSWAGMLYSIPMDVMAENPRVRVGVSACSLDMQDESEIAWTDYMTTPAYVYSNDVTINKTVIIPGEDFVMSYVDPKHEAGTWTLKDETGKVVFSEAGTTIHVPGLDAVGQYDLEIEGVVYNADGTSTTTTTTYPLFVSITNAQFGALPQILSLTANGAEDEVSAEIGEVVNLKYTGRPADGKLSRGLDLAEKGFIFKATDAGITSNTTAWTMSFWLKCNTVANGSTQFLDMRDQNTSWPQNNWGCFWSTYDSDSHEMQFTIREYVAGGSPEHKQVWDVELKPGVWTHFTIAMEKGTKGVRETVYVNGKKATPLRWSYSSNGSGDGMNSLYCNSTAWWTDAYMMLGFGRHQCAAINGIIDDVKFFNRTLSDTEVESVMNSQELENGQPKAVWTFENEAGSDNWFTNEAGSGKVKSARAEMVSGAGEGQGTYKALDPQYMSGSPYSPGEAYTVITQPSWSASKGVLTTAEGTDQAGSATVSYARGGTYNVKLTLENAYGKDTKALKVIVVDNSDGIERITRDELKTYTIDKDVFVEFSDEGSYDIMLCDLKGMTIAHGTKQVLAGDKVHVRVSSAGTYILKVVKDGKVVRSAKLLCK